MRHSIKRISKSALSVILALMMVVSTMAVGVVYTNAAITKDGVFLVTTGDQDSKDWSGGYDCTSHECTFSSSDNAYVSSYTSTTGSAVNIYIKYRVNSEETEYSISNETFNDSVGSKVYSLSKGYKNQLTFQPTIGSTYTFKIDSNFKTITVSSSSSGSDEPTPVTDDDLLSVLKGEKVMIYAGEPNGWNQSTMCLYTGSGQSGTLISKSGVNNGLEGYVLGAFYVSPDTSYYVGHSGYAPYSVKPTAGATYVLSGGESSSGFTKISTNDSGNSLYSLDKGATLTATTTCNSEIKGGSTLTVNTSYSAGTSTIGKTNSFEYYIGDSSGNYNKYTLSGGSIDTSSLDDGTYTLKTVLTDGNIYVVGDTDTFTVSSKTDLAVPRVTLTTNGVITSDTPVTLNITSSDGSTYPDGATFELVNSSGTTIDNITLSSGDNTLRFTDNIPDGIYTVKVSAGDDYNPASSVEFALKSVQLYEVTLEANADAVVTGTYINAYGVTGQTIAEGGSAKVPSGNTVHVDATGIDTANKVFSKFTYNNNDYSVSPSDIPITTNGTISTVIDTVTYRTVKIAVIEYADYNKGTENKLSSNNVTYTFGGTKTEPMTAVAEDPTAYFTVPSDKAGDWSGKGHTFYIYEVQVPSTVTSINVGGVQDVTLNDTTEYYGVFHYGAWQSINYMTSDRYYKVSVVADTSVDSGATVSATGSDSVTYGSDKLYKYQSSITLTATPSNASAFSLEKWNDGTSDITSPYTVVSDATLTAYFKANQTYAITLVNTDANLSSITSSPATETYENNTVKVTVTPKTGYECTGLTVTGDSTSTSVSVTKNDDGTYSFTMPGEAVTVTPTISKKPEYTYALVGASTIKDSSGQTAAWNDKTSDGFNSVSSLKFTNNKLVVTAEKDNQFRFIGTDGTNYYHYGSANKNNETIVYGTTYNTKLDDKLVYKFNEAGTFEIEITSGTDSPMSFKVTKLATYYIGGRFKVKASEGATDFTYTATTSENNSQWNDKSKKIPFTYAGDGIYKLDTYCTIKELSEQISNNSPYFLIHDGTTKFVSNVSKMHDMEDHNESRKVTLKKFSSDTTDDYLLFSDTSSTDTSLVTLYLDTTGTNLQIYYVAESGKTALDAPSITTNVESLSTEKPTATITVTPADTYPVGMAVEYYLYNGGTYVDKTTGTTFTVHSAGTYTVKAYPPADNPDYKESVDSNPVVISDVRTPVVLKAMHGIKNGEVYTGTTVAEAANTSSSVVENTSANLAGGIQYTVTKGSTVKLTTTMVADTTTAEKFVYAYVVNNKDTYLATEGIAATGEGDKKYATYSATFTIDEDATDTTFTVVPIYYYKACANDGEYIKFYVNPSDSSWGNNVYNYTYYLGSTTYESEGNWPGQPMLYDETKQLYYSLVPKEIKGQTVSGLTVNNNGEQQTYDFDDFKYIYESGYDIVRLDLKYRSGHTLNKTTIGASYTTADGFAEPSNTITVDTFAGRWESFNDINGNPMSLLGKEVTGTTKVYVVSTALHDMQTGGENRGKYMTSWYVYQEDSNGNLSFVTAACPSDFVPRPYSGTQTEKGVNTSAYNKILDSGLGNSPVQIVFEDGQLYDSKTRIDGRWYYAQSDSEVSAYAYYRTTNSDGTNPSELFQNAAYASVNGAVRVTNPKLGLEVSVVSSPLAGYIFDHWSVVDKAGNTLIEKLDNVGASFTTTLDQEMHYVANFVKAAEGSLVINHSKYVGSDAKGGLGYYRLEVQVYRNGAWTDIKSGTGTGANGQSVTIDVDSATDTYIRIKLITETAGENTFRYWYTRSSNGMEIIEDPDGDMTHNGSSVTEPTGLSGTLTYTFETEVWKLFRDNTQIINQMNFYSDIAPMTKNYKLTYIYDDRFGNQKSYVVTGTHDDSYYVKNKNSWAPNEELIYEKAPYIDDLYKDCTWTMTQCTKDGTDATLTAVQKNKKYTVDIYNAKNECETDQFAINSYVKNNAGQFYVADATNADGKEFSYWAVYERIVGADGKVTQGKEVARHFYRKYTLVVLDNYIIKPVYGAVVEDKAYISDPQYSREQSTNADGTVVTDTLYVDFMLAYMSSTGALINSDPTKYKTGVLVELGQNYVLPVDAEGNVTETDFSKYAFTKNSTDEKLTEATQLVNGKSLVYNYGDSVNKDYRRIYNFTANSSDYNNMNRLDYFVAFKNSPANRKYVMKAYYYVIVGDKVIISEPVCFNLYEVGTSTVS